MRNKIKKFFLALLTSFTIFSFSILPALADFDWPSPSDAAQEGAEGVTSKYGLDENALVENAEL
ncbi:MAG: hypothetical protein ACOYS2_01485 [Patescibacteria group bacterium]